MKYSEDPLLKSQELILHNQILNLYSALLKIEDFKTSRPLNKFPYVIMNNFDYDLNKFNDLIINFEKYLGQNISVKTIKNWLQNKIFPLPLLRIISLNSKDPNETLSGLIQDIQIFTNYRATDKIILPLKYSDLLLDKHIHFYGYLMGDGCISGNLIKMCDGHLDEAKLHYSEKFMKLFQKYLKESYNLESTVKRVGNCYHLETSKNKFMARYFKYFYDYYKDQELIEIPSIIENNSDKIKIFLRGFFDADSGIHDLSNSIILKSKDANFLEDCKIFLENNGICLDEVKLDFNNVAFISISSTELLKYAKIIGYCHPRKKELLLNKLKKDCPLKMFYGPNTQILIDNKYFDFTELSGIRLINLHNIIKDIRIQIGTQKEASELFGFTRRSLGKYETGAQSIPLDKFLKIVIIKNKVELIEMFKKYNAKFCFSNNKGAIKLPLSIEDINLNILKYLSPTRNRTIVRTYGTINIKPRINQEKLFNEIEKLFGVKISKDVNSHCIYNNTLSKFLNYFFEYKPAWNKLNEQELSDLCKNMSVNYDIA